MALLKLDTNPDCNAKPNSNGRSCPISGGLDVEPATGDMVYVKFDEGWFRGLIKEVSTDGMLSVRYDDASEDSIPYPDVEDPGSVRVEKVLRAPLAPLDTDANMSPCGNLLGAKGDKVGAESGTHETLADRRLTQSYSNTA